LRFNFVVAAHLVSALHSSVFARLASGAFYETIVLVTFCEIIKFHFSMKFGKPFQNDRLILKVKSERISAKNFPNRRWILDE
ncbi:MAG: hypothetical protein NTV04_11450, partial [Deltaproteobacteria bacterium]|nr:hypothetical protein [Deltaproteobacteria bacterium]